MKKSFLLPFAALLVFSFAACSPVDTATSPTPGTDTSAIAPEELLPRQLTTPEESSDEAVPTTPPTNEVNPQLQDEPITQETSPEVTHTLGVTVQRDIVYNTDATTASGGRQLTLDLYAPSDADGNPLISNQPAVLLIHGGAFLLGSKDMPEMQQWAEELAQNGYVVANINYRLILSSPTVTNSEIINYLLAADTTAALPSQAPAESIDALRIGLGAAIEDASSALTWLVSQGVNPDSIAVAGASAGAITALHLTYLNDTLNINPVTPAAVINLYGAMSQPGSGASPISPGEPPLWTLHGTSDTVVPYQAASYLREQTSESGVPHTLHTVNNAGHGFEAVQFYTGRTESSRTYFDDSVEFLKEHLQ